MSEVITNGNGEVVRVIGLPEYTAEVAFWSQDYPGSPLMKVTAKGPAKAVAHVVESAADAFIEDAER